MTTVINNPGDGGSGVGVIVGVLVTAVLVVLFFVYALPALRGTAKSGINVNVQMPAPSNQGTPQ